MWSVKNHIEKIIGEGNSEIKGKEEIKEEAHHHFKRLLTTEEVNTNYEDFIRHIPSLVSNEANVALTKHVEEEELQIEIWNLHPNKAPRLDGFSIAFYRSF